MKYISKDNLVLYDNLIKDYITNKATNLQEMLAYGVQWSEDSLDPHLTRIGNMSMHKTLPIQNNMKGVIAQKSKIIYYLDENDWRWRREPLTVKLTIVDNTIVNDIFSTKQYEKQWLRIGNEEVQVISIDTTTKTATLDKTPTLTGEQTVELGAVLNGYDGTVRVKVPKFYIKAYKDGLIRQVWVSTTKIDDSWAEQPSVLIDAYRSTYLNTVPENMGFLSTLKTEEFISVQNSNTYCRGGNNRVERDGMDTLRTDLNKPRTNVNITNFRPKQVDQHILSYFEYKNIFYWLYVIEYANFNSQETFNSDLTTDGFKQGGLGNGVTIIRNWNQFNNYYPIIPSGYTNEFGNSTNIKTIETYSFDYSTRQYLNIANNYGTDNSVIDYTKPNNTILVTNIKKTTARGIYINWYDASGTHKYKVEGLQEGQSITFKSGSYSVDVTTDGEYTIEWDINTRDARTIWFNFIGACNITLSVISTSSAQITLTESDIQVPRWHGIEQPFGDIWTILDGFLMDATIIDTNQTKVYICKNPEYFSSTLTENYKLIGTTLYQDGWGKSWKFTSEADLLTESVGANSTSGRCDYYYITTTNMQLKQLYVGGSALNGSPAGLGCLDLAYFVGYTWTVGGVRSVSSFFGF